MVSVKHKIKKVCINCAKAKNFKLILAVIPVFLVIVLVASGAMPEKTECSDGIDNDGDGVVDFFAYPGSGPILGDDDCLSKNDLSESHVVYGDGRCQPGESCSSSPLDCGRCPA